MDNGFTVKNGFKLGLGVFLGYTTGKIIKIVVERVLYNATGGDHG